jgi:signal transduction histidine kinase
MDGVLEAPEPTRDAAALIHREAERMRRLVEDLLLLSKMEARDRTAARGTVDVAELLDTISQRLQLVARDRGLHLVLELPERLLAEGDASQLEHLFGNLLDNAAKYSPDGGTITVRAALVTNAPGRLARPGGAPQFGARSAAGPGTTRPLVSVTVHNTGSYIPPEDLPHIFDRFYRVDKSRSRQVAGSGLGLAIAREVVERHGGTIRAESDPVAGTTFAVTLPAAALSVTAPAAPSETAGAVPRSAGLGRVAALRPGWPRSVAITRPSRHA